MVTQYSDQLFCLFMFLLNVDLFKYTKFVCRVFYIFKIVSYWKIKYSSRKIRKLNFSYSGMKLFTLLVITLQVIYLSLNKPQRNSVSWKKYFRNFLRWYTQKIVTPGNWNLDVPEVLNVHMNEIYKKLTTIK